jgi:hypothetical protein
MPQSKPRFARTVVADRLDLRDRPYIPDVSKAPPADFNGLKVAGVKWDVLNQGQTSACTGFALARVVDYLLHRSNRGAELPVSPFMLYSMARRYDEFAGWKGDTGSSLRGALKGWYKHGACSSKLWQKMAMPPANPSDPTFDWWQESAKRPLGAYYRIDTRAVTDMHLALRDVGIIYASAVCHVGWDEGFNVENPKGWAIPYRDARPTDGGHAFAIVGYDRHGFLILNSWGPGWGDQGLATLTYRDWLDNAMDCWVAQLGVVTDQHEAVSRALTLRTDAGSNKVQLAADRNLRNQELAPFVVDMENNGHLSRSGDFRTSREDLEALVDIHLAAARKKWNADVVDVALYAHGGLTDESTAADTAARWIPALYESQIFPIFLMWETDLWSTLKNRFQDLVADLLKPPARPTAGLRDQLQRFLNERLEHTLARPGSVIWGEMKQNAEAISQDADSGARVLYEVGERRGAFSPKKVRLHLIGHSAGSIVHCHVVKALGDLGWTFATVHFMAPAATRGLFEEALLRRIQKGRVGAYYQYHLKEEVEERDPTCRPILGYGRSLLYLVSESFEGDRTTPVLGLERDFKAARYGEPRMKAFTSPGGNLGSSTHGGFDDDPSTMASVIRNIKTPVTAGRAASRGKTHPRSVRPAARATQRRR